MSKARIAWTSVLVVLVGLFALTYLRRNRAVLVATHGESMGTTWNVKVIAPQAARAAIEEAVAERLAHVDHLMSTYKDDSDVSEFNRQPADEPIEVHSDTIRVVKAALQMAADSDGAFDPTVRPLVAAWGFGAGAKIQPPSDEELAELRSRVGYQLVRIEELPDSEVSRRPQALVKTRPGVELDLSAVAKGFAVDQVAEALERLGYRRYLVEVGGEMRVAGQDVENRDWLIGIEDPDPDQRRVLQTIRITDRALATSGSYRNFYEVDGKRISHTIDPRTGRPVTHDLVSVTVVTDTCMRADALATTLEVLGPDEAYRYAVDHNLAVLLMYTEAGELKTKPTPAFERL